MNFWEFIGLPSKQSIVNLQNEVCSMNEKLESLKEIVAKERELQLLHFKVDEINKDCELIKDSNHNISSKLQELLKKISNELKEYKEELESVITSTGNKLKNDNEKSFRVLQQDLECMEMLLKVLALQDLNNGIDKLKNFE